MHYLHKDTGPQPQFSKEYITHLQINHKEIHIFAFPKLKMIIYCPNKQINAVFRFLNYFQKSKLLLFIVVVCI